MQFRKIAELPLSRLTLLFLLVGNAVNAIGLDLANAFGLIPMASFVYTGDRFADFFKVIFSYPSAHEIHLLHGLGLHTLLTGYMTSNPYHGIDGIATGELTHFHLPPLTTAINLFYLMLMKGIPPQILFYATILLASTALFLTGKAARDIEKGWGLAFLLSYPMFFLLQRGNFFALISSLAIINSFLIIGKGRKGLLGGLRPPCYCDKYPPQCGNLYFNTHGKR